MELQAGNIAAPERDISVTVLASSPSHIGDEVLALANGVLKIAEAIFDVQSGVDSITVRTPTLFTATIAHCFARWQKRFDSFGSANICLGLSLITG